MATKPHTSLPYAALASIALALAIGSVPVATLIALNAQVQR
jgi:hypothetical protein